jgi:hypothetical protein
MAWGCDLSYDYVKINAGESGGQGTVGLSGREGASRVGGGTARISAGWEQLPVTLTAAAM